MAAKDTRLDDIVPALPEAHGIGYVVAFSGGLDSTVLLHRLSRSGRARPLRAVHVEHDLQSAAADWAARCRSQAAAWGVPFTVMPVHVDRGSGHGLEAAAREARYAALAEAMMPGEVLVTAHHAEDQAQTFLLQAFRGSGVDGLAAMPAATDFGPGRHARPMLAIGRDAIRAYAQEHALDWLDDPSNVDPSVDRAYLDTHVWPVISRHWPSAAATLSRAAALCAESAILAREQADTDLAFCVGDSPDCLSVSRLAGLSSNRRRNLLRRWLEMRDLPSPRHRHLAHIESDCLDVVRDARPCVAWRGAEVRRYRDGLYAMPTLPTASGRWSAVWTPPEPLPLPGGGTLVAECGAGGLVPDRDYRVRLRRGGERVRLPGRAHDTALKTALQEAGVPPWARERLPLIVAGERIAAVADLWICEGFATDTGDYGWCPHWRDPPPGWPAVVDGAGRSC